MSDAKGMQPGPGPRVPRALKIALGVSLALNLLVAGLIGGALLGRDGGRGDAPALRVLGLAPLVTALPRDARDEMRRRVETEEPALMRERAEIGRGIRQVHRTLLTEPFDRAEAARALARSRAAAAALQARGHAAFLSTIEDMSPAERALVAERLGRAVRRMAERDR